MRAFDLWGKHGETWGKHGENMGKAWGINGDICNIYQN
jgi:hypothetical protein